MVGTATPPKKAYTSDEPSSSRTGLFVDGINEESALLEPSPAVEISANSGLTRQLSFLDGYTLLVSFMIGSGVFSSPSQINNNVPSPGAAVLVWACGGFLAWAGAACLAEFGAAIPVNGGMQEYMRYIYGDFAALIVSLGWIGAVKPCSMAVVSIIFAEYWTRALLGATGDEYFWLDKSLAICVLLTITVSNSISTRTSSRLNSVFYCIKLSTVGFIAVLTLLVMFVGLNGQGEEPSKDWKTRNWFANRPTQVNGRTVDWDTLSTWESMGYISAALWAGLWGYGGWDNANLVAGEMRNTSRDLPRAVHAALPTVISCFVLTNICYYIVLPWDVIGTTDTVAVAVGWKTLGSFGSFIFAILVSTACAGSLTANIFTSGRLTASAASNGLIPKFWGELGWGGSPLSEDEIIAEEQQETGYGSTDIDTETEAVKSAAHTPTTTKWRTPIRAMTLNFTLSSIYIIAGNFGSLVTFIGIAEYTSYLFAFLGLIYLRFSQPLLNRPYKPPILTPIVFCAFCAVVVVRGIVFAPVQAGLLSIYAAIITVYYRFWWRQRRSRV